MELKYLRKKKNLAEQFNDLKKCFECLPGSGIFHNVLVWIQKVKTSYNSKTYVIKIEYNGSVPKVYVNNQGIIHYKDEKIPHTYKANYIADDNQIVQLCLFYPRYREWEPHLYISEYFIPWAIEWLFYYEYWRITGHWLGGGIHNE